jgi:hypothetical protein
MAREPGEGGPWVGVVMSDSGDRLLVRTYVGHGLTDLIESYWAEARSLSLEGYEPVTQVYVDGSWTPLDVFVAVVTIPLIIGVFLTVRLLVYKPTGSLVVTYALP